MEKYIKLGKKLFPLNRSITGKGLFKTLKILKKRIIQLKLKNLILEKKFFDWKVPSEWQINNAYVKDFSGKKIIDFKNNNLHLVGYSTYIKKRIKFSELIKNSFP